jgi:hypothetical protein
VQVDSGFAVSGNQGSKVRGYVHLCLDYIGDAWEKLCEDLRGVIICHNEKCFRHLM